MVVPVRWRCALLSGRVLAVVPLVFLAVMVIAPVGRLLVEGLWPSSPFGSALGASAPSEPTRIGVWQDPHLRFRLGWSVLQALVSTGLTAALGLPMAWVLARWHFAGRQVVLRLLMLPFVVPTLVAALGLLALWGPNGVFDRWWGASLEDSPWLLILGNLFFNLCLVVRAAAEALGQVSASRLAAARSLGATPWRAFWRVEWPAIRLPVAAALCLVFLYCFSGLGLALVLGGQRWATAEVEVYTLVAHELRLAEAGALALWCMAVGGGLALVHGALVRRMAQPMRADSVQPRPVRTPRDRAVVAAALGGLAAASVAPLVATLAWALGDVPGLWAVWTHADTLDALWNTLRFSAMALVLATALGLAHGLAAHHWGGRRGALLQALGFLPFVASPVAVAFGLLLLYPDATASLGLLVAAYALLAYPFVAQAVSHALATQPPSWAQAARSLGASPWRVWWRVTLPLMAPTLRRGMAFAAATALGEFAVSLFLSRPEWTTLTTLIYQHLGRPGAANAHAAHALALLLMLLALGVFLLLDGHRPPKEGLPRA
jgi:thiamine transport system permease protein